MKRYYHVTLLILVLVGLHQLASAQQKATAPASPAPSYPLFFEKVYVHTDREYYASGDDIWFKAYLVKGDSNYPTYTSNNLYVDLVSPESKIITREIIRLDDGVGVGDFKLADSIPSGKYHLRAYTNWMRNFGDNFIFDKQITINSVPGIKAVNSADAKNKRKKNTANEDDANADAEKISFFPEGGSMIEGVMGVIGFKAEDALGNGISVNGSVVSSQGETLGQFVSTDAGLGSFTLMPVAGATYQVKGTYKNGEAFTADLPAALSEGYALHIRNTDSTKVQVIVSANQAMLDQHKGQSLTLVAKHGDKVCFEGSFKLTDAQSAIDIPKAQIPAGIASVLLYDEQMKPNCERLVYIDSKGGIKIKITPDKPAYASKEKTVLNISVTDAQNQPVKANLSLSAVDGSIVPANETNIAAYLLLQADVRGKIDNAAQYFDPANENRFKQIDLLLLTQGWRDFVWKHLADSASLKLSYLPEAGFTISGRLRSVLINKPIPDMNITLFASGAKGDKTFATRTDAQGKYFIDNLQLYGTQMLKLSSSDDKGKKSGWLFLDTLGHDPMPVKPAPFINEEPSDQLALFNSASRIRMNATKIQRPSNGNIELHQVDIKDTHQSFVSYTGEVLSTFGYPEYNYTISKKDQEYKDLEDYLVHIIPGANYNTGSRDGIVFRFNGKNTRPRLVVDGQQDIYQRLDYYALSMDQVISVRVDHFIRMGGSDVIYIYLTLKPTAFDKKEFNLINAEVAGYYSARTFYSPNYEYPTKRADQRTTIYWEPMITTDANGQATVTYYNADPKSKIRVEVQGLTDKGVPLTSTSEYSIQ